MRHLCLAIACGALLPLAASAAPSWVQISSEQGKRIEFDPGSIKKDDTGKVEAWGRIVLDRDLNDPRTGSGYRIIEALSRYDCGARSFGTVRRVYRTAEGEVLREETVPPMDRPVRSGTLDDKLLREVCRPRTGPEIRSAAGKVVEKAAAAATDLRKANEEAIKREVKKTALQSPPAEAKPAAPAAVAPVAAAPEVRPRPAPAAEAASPPRPAPAPRPRPPKPAPEPHGEAHAHSEIHWGYEGPGSPDFWGRLKPEYATCANGKRQSPIDIREGIRVDQPPIEFAYRRSLFRIVDNGHSVQVAVGGSSIVLLGKRYELIQFHFHRPSEERVDGRSFDMVAHLVHKAEDGALAVVAVLIERGKDNPFIQTLWNHLPLEKNVDVAPPETIIDPLQLLPEQRGYYSYMGSLTTPPCTEGVLWLVLKQPVSASPEQIAVFSRLYRNNARPIQPGFNRLIKESR